MHTNVFTRNNVSVEGNLEADQTIIFAHGFGTDQTAWTSVKKGFEKDYRLVLFDNVGAGRSDIKSYSPIKYATLQGYASDLLQISKTLGIKDAIYVGHSVSGMIGLLACQENVTLFKKLILIGASARYLNDLNYTGGFDQSDLDNLYEQMSNNYFQWVSGFSQLAMRNENRPSLREAFAESLLSLRADIALSVARAIFQSDFREILQNIEHQVLVIQAKEDIAVPYEAAVYLERNLKNSFLKLVNAEGHFPHISAPKEIIDTIKHFLERRPHEGELVGASC